jgi:hypothetical protein
MKKELLGLNIFSDEQREAVGGYLAWEWGFQHKLPDDHDFKWSPPPQTAQLSDLADHMMEVYNGDLYRSEQGFEPKLFSYDASNFFWEEQI